MPLLRNVGETSVKDYCLRSELFAVLMNFSQNLMPLYINTIFNEVVNLTNNNNDNR